MKLKAAIYTAAMVVTLGNTHAAELSGFAAVDLRLFTETAALPGQNSSFADPSVMLQPEVRHEWNNSRDRFTAIPFARYDSLDTYRTHWDVREFNWLHQDDGWNVQTGVGKVFWGVTESRHLIDIINQTDFVENINGEEKLGQPMLNLNVPSAYGDLSLFYLPYFRERTFQAPDGRLRFVLPVDPNMPNLNNNSRWHPDWAVRWSRTFGDWDVGVANFNGLGREPRFVPYFPKGASAPPTSLIPTYDLIDQTSLDAQGALGNWLLKLESMTRSGQGNRFAAVVTGFEYTFYSVFENSADLGLLMEYQYDGRDQFAPPIPFKNAVYVGTRLALNDEQDSKLLLGVTIDLDKQASLFGFEASRRLGDKWKIELEAKLFKNIPSTNILAGMSKDDYVQFRLVRFF